MSVSTLAVTIYGHQLGQDGLYKRCSYLCFGVPIFTSRPHAKHVSVYLCIPTYHVHNNYTTYIVAMRPYFS